MARRIKKTSDAPAAPASNSTANGIVESLKAVLEGLADIAGEVGVTATLAVRGGARAAERIGRDLLSVARDTVDGTVDAVERIAAATNGAVRRVRGDEKAIARRPAKAMGRAKERPRAAASTKAS